MKRNLALFLAAVLICNVFAYALTPAAQASNDEVNTLIEDQLAPIEEVYSPEQDVTPSTLSESIARLIRVVLGFLGIIFLVLILYAGFTWMTAAGNEEKIGTAKKTMVAAIIGAAIILAAYAITYFVIDQLLVATKGEGLR